MISPTIDLPAPLLAAQGERRTDGLSRLLHDRRQPHHHPPSQRVVAGAHDVADVANDQIARAIGRRREREAGK
jgi:hypothetical protein